MSLFGGGTADPPALKTVSIPQAQDIVLAQDRSQYALSDSDWARRFPGLASGRSAMISDLQGEMGGGISSQAMGALETAGLGNEASRIVGKNEFQTAKNLGQPILSKEQRDRNYASTLLATNPERSAGLSPQDILDIVTSNTGNINAFKQAISRTQSNTAAVDALQNAQNFSALTSLFGAGAKIATSSPYTNPYASVYNYTDQSGVPSSYYAGPDAAIFGFGG